MPRIAREDSIVRLSPDAMLDAIINASAAHGFTDPVPLSRIRSARRLPIKAGLYVLGFSTGEYYVGQSVHLRQRLLQHCGKHEDLAWVCLSYMPRSGRLRADLSANERKAIADLRCALDPLGIRTRGVASVPWTRAPTPFDTLVSQEEQQEWLDDPYAMLEDGERPTRHIDAASIEARFRKLSEHADWPAIRRVISLYTANMLPRPRITEAQYWGVSCFPSGGPAIRINISWQTTFDVFLENDNPTFAFYVPISLIKQHYGLDQTAEYPNVSPTVTISDGEGLEIHVKQEAIGLSKGGASQIAITIADAESAIAFLCMPPTILMLRQFALGLMKQGANPRPTSHCTLLADEMLRGSPEVLKHDELANPDSPTALPPVPSELSIASIAGKYHLIERISSGGQGEVWRGRTDGGSPCAIKLVPRPRRFQDRDELSRRFDDEAKAGRLVRSPHVCEMIDAGTVDALPAVGLTHGAHYLVLEFITGGTLFDRNERTDEFELHELRSLSKAMCGALAAAHELSPPIVHRDIKPENIMLPNGDVARAKLADFGISRQFGDTQLTTVGGVTGTWVYMSPEQVSESWSATPAADQYSLALVLWEFVLYEVPGLTNTELGTRRVRKRGIQLLSFEVEGKRRRNLERVFQRALQADPNARFGSIREFAAAFDEAGIEDRLWS